MMSLKSWFLGMGVVACVGCSLDWTVPSGSGIGGAGGVELVQITCTSSEVCTCAAGQACSMSCSADICDIVCEPASFCSISCSGAECAITCEAGSTCVADCDGALCTTTCESGAQCGCTPDAFCN